MDLDQQLEQLELQMRQRREYIPTLLKDAFSMSGRDLINSFFDYSNPESIFNRLASYGVRFKDNSEELGEEFFLGFVNDGYTGADESALVNFMQVETSSTRERTITVSMPRLLVNYLPDSVMSRELEFGGHEWDVQMSLRLTILEELVHILQTRSAPDFVNRFMRDRSIYETGRKLGYTQNVLREHDAFFTILEMLGYDISTPFAQMSALTKSRIQYTKWFRARTMAYGNSIYFFRETAEKHFLFETIRDLLKDANKEKWNDLYDTYQDMKAKFWEIDDIEKAFLDRYAEIENLPFKNSNTRKLEQ